MKQDSKFTMNFSFINRITFRSSDSNENSNLQRGILFYILNVLIRFVVENEKETRKNIEKMFK